jgi:Di-haem oxidoreductase, putative peroxidase
VPGVPKTWDDDALRQFELPRIGLGQPARHVSAEYYYRMPVDRIPRTYPVYAPDREPGGYLAWLMEQEPEEAIDFSRLRSKDDWLRAGQVVFDAPFRAALSGPLAQTAEQWRRFSGTQFYPRAARDGTYPWARYWVAKKGDVRAFFTECGSCHTRVLDDGTVVPGAQGNLNEGIWHTVTLREAASVGPWIHDRVSAYAAPWLHPDPAEAYKTVTLDDAIDIERQIPAGVRDRDGASHLFPPKMPDLIGVAGRKYLDATGLIRHRSIADLMRYAALVDGTEALTDYNGFRPAGKLPDPRRQGRLSDEALYALAQYIYSLQPPPNPNRPDALSRRGESVFSREGCAVCHTPPLYTNNTLVPVAGFAVPAAHRTGDDIMTAVMDTDPRLTLQSRKGTGYYRVPSLRGVWYRGPFEHNGSVATLEDWFDPARLRDDYRPSGFVGFGVTTRAVKGHRFGLTLAQTEKDALIAFLRTL